MKKRKILELELAFNTFNPFFSVAEDFKENKMLATKCDQSLDSTQKILKISLRYPRALNSGWLPTNPTDVNHNFNCKSDLGTFGVTFSRNFPVTHNHLQHGQSYSLIVSPSIIKSDENIRSIPPQL